MKKSSDIMVSVIILTYNQEKYIKQAINSAINQKTSFNYEIIIGNDCSPDNTKNILKKIKGTNKCSIYVINRDKNVGPNLNSYLCTKEAKGKYVAFLEGDDYWIDEYKLQKQVDFLEKDEKQEFVGVAADFNDVDLEGNFLIKHSENKGKFKKIIDFNRLKNGNLDFHINSFMCRNIFFSKIKDYSVMYKIDKMVSDFVVPLLLSDYGNIYVMSDVVGCYRVCENRYNLRFIEHTLQMMKIARGIEKYKFTNHKSDFSIRKSKLIVDAYLVSFLKKEKISKEEKKELFNDLNIKILLLMPLIFIYKIFDYIKRKIFKRSY